MPKIKQTPPIEFRLSTDDHMRLDSLCKVKGKKRTELTREAVVWYLDNQEKIGIDSRETLLEKRIKKMEERLAALQARCAIDIGMVYQLLYLNMSKETRDADIAWAYQVSIKRLKKKLQGHTKEIEEVTPKSE